ALRKIIRRAAKAKTELLNVQVTLTLGAGVDPDFVVLRRINNDIIPFRPEVENFGVLLLDLRRARKDVAVADEKPELAVHGIDFDASRFRAALIAGEPGVEI